ncbi:hypothetical protein J2Y67_000634 [Neobacillus niacini]|nr:hypothetical protein [Neobacillus niacini]
MFKPIEVTQSEYELVPDDPLLGLIGNNIDFSFLLENVHTYYNEDNGSLTDPLILFKICLLGIFLGYVLIDNMVGGRVLFTDSTHLKASTNKHKYTKK